MEEKRLIPHHLEGSHFQKVGLMVGDKMLERRIIKNGYKGSVYKILRNGKTLKLKYDYVLESFWDYTGTLEFLSFSISYTYNS